MQMQQYILNTIPVFEMGDSLKEVIHFFTHSTYSHVGITEEGRFKGLLGEADLESFQPSSLIEVFTRNEANLLPVVDENEVLLGYYDLNDVVDLFTDMPFFTEPGAILVVSKPMRDYSFSEIAQIVEGNNTKLLGAFITTIENETVQVTLKIGDSNINEVLQTFRRYHYQVLSGSIDDKFLEELKQRSDYLDKYLNV